MSTDTSLDVLLSSASGGNLASVAFTSFCPPLLDCLGLTGLGVLVAGTLVLASVAEAVSTGRLSSSGGGKRNSALSCRPLGTRCMGGSFAIFLEFNVLLEDDGVFGMMVGVVTGRLWSVVDFLWTWISLTLCGELIDLDQC